MNVTFENVVPVSARDAKKIVADLFILKSWIYWCDLTLSAVIGYTAIAIYLSTPAYSPVQLIAFLVGGFAFFRMATFMHEIVHMRKGHKRGFKLFWNIIVGIPLLTPSLFYTIHADHHSNRFYGTPNDGEYLPFGATPPRSIVQFMLMFPLIPLLAIVRALILVPISCVVPTLRRWVLSNASAAVISPNYRRRKPPTIFDPLWLASDIACFVYAAGIALLVAHGKIPLVTIGLLYLLVVFAIGLNWLRTLAAHRYRNTGQEMNHFDQVQDSINVTGHPLFTELLYPVGLGYHALHHLLPSLPYHALGQAHRRLIATLPDNSSYQKCSCSTLPAIAQLWRDAAASRGPNGVTVKANWRQI